MKKWINLSLAVLALTILVLAACQKEKELVFTESNKPLTGSWKIVKALRNGEDMTSRFDFTAFRINFKDSSYTITDPVPFVVNKNGKWRFDDPQYPLELTFQPEGGNATKPVFKYPVVKGKRSLILTFSPGCTSSKYEYTLEPLPQ
ncbi:DUF5004 domain-containing protein [Paraflavitalea sp. CAU 1676]|uniref:DUF5004 domain-containing protein n=1 Tax=Paraflavitalea sp. CAU 1676 TaxID=3032598 RepID=UPI0023D9994D|nr:DUF5004 domain-containing protein [Paraflavitalea sp. CAU 1676]MDF2192316.1 DUF5004 domain-containing protein [Paraflavitalea sp. CAU 1676]